MLKKEEVYVVLEKNKHHDKFRKIINMFNVDCTVDIRGIAVFDSSFFPYTQNKTRVSLKELRNILAREYIKEGDVIALGYGKSVEYIGVFKAFNNGYFEVNRYLSLNSGSGILMNDSGYIKNFIRYATEEEKQLLKPQESVIDKAISLLQHGLGLDYSHGVIQGLEKLKNK